MPLWLVRVIESKLPLEAPCVFLAIAMISIKQMTAVLITLFQSQMSGKREKHHHSLNHKSVNYEKPICYQ